MTCSVKLPSVAANVFHSRWARVHRLGEGDALDPAGGLVGGDEVGDLALERDLERVLVDGRLVGAGGGRPVVELDAVAEGGRGRLGDPDRQRADAIGLGRGQRRGCGEAPRAVDQDADAEALALARRRRPRRGRS